MPVEVVAIVRDYAHTYSDSEVNRLLNDREYYLRVDHMGKISCGIGNNRQNYKIRTSERHYPCVFSYTSDLRHADIPRIRIGHIPRYMDVTWVYLDVSGWDSILYHFDTHRGNTWDLMQSGVPMPSEFIHWCDTFIRILEDQLRSSKSMMCPWQKSDGRI